MFWCRVEHGILPKFIHSAPCYLLLRVKELSTDRDSSNPMKPTAPVRSAYRYIHNRLQQLGAIAAELPIGFELYKFRD